MVFDPSNSLKTCSTRRLIFAHLDSKFVNQVAWSKQFNRWWAITRAYRSFLQPPKSKPSVPDYRTSFASIALLILLFCSLYHTSGFSNLLSGLHSLRDRLTLSLLHTHLALTLIIMSSPNPQTLSAVDADRLAVGPWQAWLDQFCASTGIRAPVYSIASDRRGKSSICLLWTETVYHVPHYMEEVESRFSWQELTVHHDA